MGDTDRDERQAPKRVSELKDKIQQATELIGELREANYALSGELAELKREIDARPEPDSGASSARAAAGKKKKSTGGDGDFGAELEALRSERQTIRAKVALLLERIDKLET